MINLQRQGQKSSNTHEQFNDGDVASGLESLGLGYLTFSFQKLTNNKKSFYNILADGKQPDSEFFYTILNLLQKQKVTLRFFKKYLRIITKLLL